MAQKTKQYLVKWEIELMASSPEEAAKLALEIQRDKNSEALAFDVHEYSSNSTFEIDLIDELKPTGLEDIREYLRNLVLDENGSEEIQLDNLDWAKIVKTDSGNMVENEHGTQFDIDDLSDEELEIFWHNL